MAAATAKHQEKEGTVKMKGNSNGKTSTGKSGGGCNLRRKIFEHEGGRGAFGTELQVDAA